MAEKEKVEATVKETPAQAQASTAPAASNSNADTMAIAALILGVLNLCSWCLPICGCPMSIIGIVLGVMGMKSEKNKTLAIIGLVLSVFGLVASIGSAILGLTTTSWDYNYDWEY
ncbi:DUF4190 domain-containing protein [Candidatus Dojkabacteria bacterium]|nr:DUF4190 domain-containing protein [Candidatus Dojkabacteria bacterium]